MDPRRERAVEMTDAPLFEQDHAEERQQLSGRFGLPPFSTLNTRSQDWQALKRKWNALGIRSWEGRPQELISTGSSAVYGGSSAWAGEIRSAGTDEVEGNFSTSIFDPVLAEIAYEWYAPKEGWILDPFAGGSTRGVVASKIGRRYIGVDLREEQVAANYAQAAEVCTPNDPAPIWRCGNSLRLPQILDGALAGGLDLPSGFDFLFSCPPYFDLEQYSSDPEDLSNLSWPAFLEQYRWIISASSALLAEDRFAAFVVGEVRDKQSGCFRGFVPETVRAFQDAGLHFYTEAIIETSLASAALRAGRIFSAGRKLVKVHQSLLVFVKGDWKKAAERLGREVSLVLGAEPEAEQLELLSDE